jgi:hypothetical protein
MAETYHFQVPIVLKLISWNPQDLSRPVGGLLYFNFSHLQEPKIRNVMPEKNEDGTYRDSLFFLGDK